MALALKPLMAVPLILLIVALVEGDGLDEPLKLRAIEPGIARFVPGATATERLIAPAMAWEPSVLLVRLMLVGCEPKSILPRALLTSRLMKFMFALPAMLVCPLLSTLPFSSGVLAPRLPKATAPPQF